jgi:predicted nucleic acid-binding protein
MRYVLDSNVALKWVLNEADSLIAIRIGKEFQQGIHDLLAPDVFIGEVGHSLTRLERRGLILPADGAQKFSDILAAIPAIYPSLSVSSRAYDISSQTRHGFYDCLYVALAEREGCELVTADDQLVKNLQGSFPFIKPLASLP